MGVDLLRLLGIGLLILGATLRLTHLVVSDRIMRPLRDVFTKPARDPITEKQVGDEAGRALFRAPDRSWTRTWADLPGWRKWMDYLVHCPWCVGLWLSPVVTWSAVALPPDVLWVHAGLTVAWLVGLIEAQVGGDDE